MKKRVLTLVSAMLIGSMFATGALAGNKNKVKKTDKETTTVKWSLPSNETDEEKAERMKWWTDSRFGMFIHWGLYSMPARHEWVKHNERISDEWYQKYFEHFNPDLFDPHAWAKMAKAAGMKYVVLTTKHHEGFCMWDSQYTDYKAPNTPAKRDLLREFVDAFREEGIHIGFYYSLLDWHHPDFLYDGNHPFTPAGKTIEEMNKGRDMKRYQQYMKDQVTELLTNYGKIDIIWFDFSYGGRGRDAWDSEGLLTLAKNLQPGIIVDDRLDLKDVPGGWDIYTPEQFKVKEWPVINGKKAYWETCQTFSGSWGYYRDETTWKSPAQLLELLIETVSKGGNLLLNVGPTSRGEFDQRAQDRLAAMGKWMHYNSRAIYECTQAPEGFEAPDNCLLTYNPTTNVLYISMLDYPLNELKANFMDKVDYAQFLHDGSEIKFNDQRFELPVLKPDVEIPVIEVFLKK